LHYFIGIALPDAIRKELVRTQESLKEKELFLGKCVIQENLHITLLFLGKISHEELTHIKEGLSRFAFRPFTVQLEALGTTSRIVWVTVPSEELRELYHSLIALMPSYAEQREYTGHITIARVKKFLKKEIIPQIEIAPLSWKVTSFGLYVSRTYQEGPEYTLIEEYNFC
jgi:2'-5' RNA ligase